MPFTKEHKINIGRKHSSVTKAKISAAHVGRRRGTMSEAHRNKIAEGLRGRKRPPFSEEWRRKMSEAGKGKTFSAERRAKLKGRKPWNKGLTKATDDRIRKYAEKVSGQSSHSWRGGVTPINKQIRKSIEYKLWREAVYRRDDYTCQFCGIRGGILHPDHIKPFSSYPELRFDINNGRTLCQDCHRKTDTWGFSLIHKRKVHE